MPQRFFIDILFFKSVLQEDQSHETRKDGPVKGEPLEMFSLARKIHVEAEGSKQKEEQSLKKVFSSGAHC